MPPADGPLTREDILATAEDVIRRFGPEKATVMDVARALGVSHTAVYRHVASKAELQDLVVGRWMEEIMPPLRTVAAQPGPAPQRLRRLMDALIAVKRRRAAEDPQLFASYRALAANAKAVVAAHVDHLVGLLATVIRAGAEEGTLRALSLPDLLPDFVVYDEKVAPARGQLVLGSASLRAAGFFGLDWSLPAL